MMEQKTTRRFPWVLVLFLCLYIGVTALAVTTLGRNGAMNTSPVQPNQTEPAEADHETLFRQLFAQPDWGQLYTRAGLKDGKFEGSEAFAAYMDAKVGAQTLTYYQVRTDLSDSRRFVVCLGNEKIAAFTMREKEAELTGLELFYEAIVSVTVETPLGYTVFVNGVALDDSFVVRTAQTKAETYLPEGIHGMQRQWLTVDGLLTEPEVKAQDEAGQAVQMEKDSETGIYCVVGDAAPEMTEEQAALARKAAIADANYSIGTISAAQLREYFDEQTPLYKLLTTNNRNIQGHKGSSIDETAMVVGEYCRYSDTLYSVNVKLTQKIIRLDGTVKVYTADKTYFFTERDGRYRVTSYTYEHMTEQVEQVRLKFVTEQDCTSQMVSTSDTAVAAPEVTAPAGQVLVGWAVKMVNGDQVTMTVRVLPDGTVLGGLEPMELYPVFDKEENP